MRVSLNTIKQFTTVGIATDELVAKINAQLGSVESVTDLADRYKDAVIAKIVSCEKHPNADKLSVCEIDAGTGETVRVVCGAPNVREGLLVVWLPPGATVPSTATDAEPFVLEARELRGVVSNGMLASKKELGLGDDHDGILEIDATEWRPNQVELMPGARFAAAYGLDDTVIDIENKMFTHRPDLFGQIGVAREIAGIQHLPFDSPDWYKTVPSFENGEGLPLTVSNDAKENVPRFMAVVIRDVNVGPSPLWLQIELVRLGSKSINNVVDATNYIMLLTSQPTHAYDYDKLRGNKLGVRMAQKGEKVKLLNQKNYTLHENDIVIVDGEGPVGLGGIMGGGDSDVSDSTKNIVLEVATFDMYAVRKSSMRHGVFTDALTRFNKGQSPLQNPHIINLLMQSIHDVAGGRQASVVFDEATPIEAKKAVSVTPEFINQRLGLGLSFDTIKELLANVEFVVEGDKTLLVSPPFWRTDIEIAEDVVEEVGRLYGFDALPQELPQRSIFPTAENPKLVFSDAIRQSLSRAGANEVLTYSFVPERTMSRAGQDVSQAFTLSNALSPDLRHYRLSVLPSLLEKVHPNMKAGYDEFVLYELGKGHNNKEFDPDGLPVETELLEFVYAAKKPAQGAAYFHAKRYVEQLAADLRLEVSFEKMGEVMDSAEFTMFDLKRSALITLGGETVGVIGELKQSVIKNFKLPDYVSAATLDLGKVENARNRASPGYTPLPRYPKVTQDISLRVADDVPYDAVLESVTQSVAGLKQSVHASLHPISIYRPATSETKTITLRLTVASYEKTLTDKDVSALLERAAQNAAAKLGAERA